MCELPGSVNLYVTRGGGDVKPKTKNDPGRLCTLSRGLAVIVAPMGPYAVGFVSTPSTNDGRSYRQRIMEASGALGFLLRLYFVTGVTPDVNSRLLP
jgi:hypothetical protein